MFESFTEVDNVQQVNANELKLFFDDCNIPISDSNRTELVLSIRKDL